MIMENMSDGGYLWCDGIVEMVVTSQTQKGKYTQGCPRRRAGTIS